MCEAFAELSQKFSEFSLSKFSSILKQPTMNLLMSSLKCDCNALEDIIELFFQIDKMKDFSQIEEFTKMEKVNTKKTKFYEILSDVVVTKTKKYIASIIPLIKQKLTQILEIYKGSNQDKNEMGKKLLEVQKKLDQIVFMAMTKIKSACQKLQQLVVGTQKLKKWNCECLKPKCKNRYNKGYIWKYIFRNIILPNQLLKVCKIQDVQNCSIHNNFQKIMHFGQENSEQKSEQRNKVDFNLNFEQAQQDVPFCKNGEFSLFVGEKQKNYNPCSLGQKTCQKQKQIENFKPKQKKKKKKKKKGGIKIQICDQTQQQKDLDELQTNQSTGAKGEIMDKIVVDEKMDPEFKLVLKNMQQLSIDEQKRIDCYISDKYLTKWSKRSNKMGISTDQCKDLKRQLRKYSNFDYMQ